MRNSGGRPLTSASIGPARKGVFVRWNHRALLGSFRRSKPVLVMPERNFCAALLQALIALVLHN
jgi:hypothetical protein